jgi:galactose mutarotase-like enzyme
MFHARTVDGDPSLVELTDTDAGSLAVVAPARGGMLTRFVAGGLDVLYLDEATFRDPTKNVRGGVPVLFPSPGKLTGDAFACDGRRGNLKQHGFARNLPWRVERVTTGTELGASVTLGLSSSEETRRAYPWDFELAYTYTLRGAGVTIEQRITNRGEAPMPFGAGFHPYFHVPQGEKAGARIATKATRAFDNVTKQETPFVGFDLTAAEVDLHLVDHGSSSATLAWAGRAVTVACSPDFTHWVVWTLAGRDFVCLEPWTCPGDALNTGDRLIRLAPGETRTLTTILSVG